jgi:hypothetical protein
MLCLRLPKKKIGEVALPQRGNLSVIKIRKESRRKSGPNMVHFHGMRKTGSGIGSVAMSPELMFKLSLEQNESIINLILFVKYCRSVLPVTSLCCDANKAVKKIHRR